MTSSFVVAIVFVTAALLVMGGAMVVSDLVSRPRARVQARLDREFQDKLRERAKKSSLFRNLHEIAADPAVRDPTLWTRFTTIVEQSGLEVTPKRLLWMAGVVGVSTGTVATWLSHHVVVGFFTAVVGCAAPLAYVHFVRRRRLRLICEQLPAAFDLISRSVEAGQTISRAFQLVGDECEPPLSTEFAYCFEQCNLGLPADVALRDLARRVGVIELQMFVVALIVQRQTGGNPVEMLANLATVIRNRIRLQGKLRTFTAEGRMQAVVLTVLPLVMFGGIYVLNREYAEVLLERPRLLWGMLASEIAGVAWISRIVQLEA